MAQFANSWRSGPDHHDDWDSTSKIIEVNADKGKYAGEFPDIITGMKIRMFCQPTTPFTRPSSFTGLT